MVPELEEILRTGKEWEFFVQEAEKQFASRLGQEYLGEIMGTPAHSC